MAEHRLQLPLTDADHEQLRAFGEQHDLQIHLQGGGSDSITPLWPETPTPLYYRLPEYGVTLHFRPTDFIQISLNRGYADTRCMRFE